MPIDYAGPTLRIWIGSQGPLIVPQRDYSDITGLKFQPVRVDVSKGPTLFPAVIITKDDTLIGSAYFDSVEEQWVFSQSARFADFIDLENRTTDPPAPNAALGVLRVYVKNNMLYTRDGSGNIRMITSVPV